MVVIVYVFGDYVGGYDYGDVVIGEFGDVVCIICIVCVDMVDIMCFMFVQIIVQCGEMICFEVVNSGYVWYEMMLGILVDFFVYVEQMCKYFEMEYVDGNVVIVDLGQYSEIVWYFMCIGLVEFVCLQFGYFEVGMCGVVQVCGNRF